MSHYACAVRWVWHHLVCVYLVWCSLLTMRALSVLLAVGAAWAAVSMTNASSTPDASIANVYDLWDSVRKLLSLIHI